MSSVAAPPEPRLLARVRAVPSAPPELWFGAALTLILAAIGLRAGGGLSLGPTAKLEIALDAGGGVLAAVAALSAGVRRWWGATTTALFAVLAGITAISIVWAIQPSNAWLEANRTVSYFAVFGAGVVLARLGGAWWPAMLRSVVASAVIICGWAVLTKVFPGALAPEEVYARLREPYGYWNAVGLTAALGVPATLWLGARRSGHAAVNALAYPAMGLLLLTMLLAYSRGSLLAVAAGCAFWFAVAPLRLRGVAVLAGGAIGALLVTAWAFSRDTLTQDRVALDLRSAAGHDLGIAALVMLLVLTVLGLAIGFAAARRPPSPGARRRAGAAILVAVGLVPVVLVLGLALSSKGLGGSISSGWKSLTDPHASPTSQNVANDPSRLTKVGSVRAQYWNESYKIFRAHPVTGVGAGGYATARPRYRQDATLSVQHAHGYVVQTAADLGIVGLLASLALLAAWLLATGRTLGWSVPLPARVRALLRRGPPPAPAAPVAAGERLAPERVAMVTLATTVLIFGIHSFIDWTWFVPGTAVLALLCAGWVAGRGPLSEAPGSPPDLGARVRAGVRSPWRVGAACLALAVGIAAAWTAWQPQRSVGTGNEALAALDSAAKDPAAFDRARHLAGQARAQNPLSVEPLFELAVIESVAGRKAAARNALEKAVRLQPSNPATWLRLTEFALDQQDDPKLALRLLGPALYLDPKSAEGASIYLQALRRAQTKAQG